MRCLTWFEVYLTNLELTHLGAINLIGSCVLGTARTLIPESLCDIDRTMEKTFMKFEKGSVLSFLLMSYKFKFLFKTSVIHSAFCHLKFPTITMT